MVYYLRIVLTFVKASADFKTITIWTFLDS